MISRKDFNKITDWLWEIPKSFRQDMRVPARFYISEKMMNLVLRDRSLQQLVNVASLPGIINYSIAMPDMHEGYGFPIGGVAATRLSDGVISPGGVGYDINCGVRILKSEFKVDDIKESLDKVATEIQKQVPSGLGRGREKKINQKQFKLLIEGGIPKLVEQGYGEKQDIENCEAGGFLDSANAGYVSEKAKKRGADQIGTLGSGNHFCEIQKVEQILNEPVAKSFGLFLNQIVVMIHTGSRGFGHQIATDYIRLMMQTMGKYNISLPDRELAACPINSEEGRQYLAAMSAGANFAWCNRHMISFYVKKAWQKVFGEINNLSLLYDVAHNLAKVEEYEINGQKTKVCVHRKGATRAFPSGNSEIPEKYREIGQPVLVPGSMGTASYVLVGTHKSKEAFHSVCHGAGRTMSRRQAVRTISGQELVQELNKKGIIVKCHSPRGIAEEAPLAYKDIDGVVEVVDKANLAKKVARLIPLAVIKGE